MTRLRMVAAATLALSFPFRPRRDASAQANGTAAPALADTAALGSFLDGVMQAHLDQLRMPAAVVDVVQGDRVLYAKGYSHADLA